MNFKWDDAKYNAWVDAHEGPVIPAMMKFVEYLEANQVKFAFITGRDEKVRKVTEANLQNFGLENRYVELIMRTSSDKNTPAAEFKLTQRYKLSKDKGYNIIACVGDQVSDCTGSYTGFRFKVPNYMYLIQ